MSEDMSPTSLGCPWGILLTAMEVYSKELTFFEE